MKQITSYQTIDGTIFTNNEDATKHEMLIKFKELIKSHPFDYSINYTISDPSTLLDWLYENRSTIQSILFSQQMFDLDQDTLDKLQKEMDISF